MNFKTIPLKSKLKQNYSDLIKYENHANCENIKRM